MNGLTGRYLGGRLTILADQRGIDGSRLRGRCHIPLGHATLCGLGVSSSCSDFCGGLLLLLFFDLLWVSVEEHIDHDVPAVRGPRDGATETEDLASEKPPNETDGVAGFVVCGDSDVDKLKGCVSVAEGNDRDVDVGGLTNGLVVDTGVCNDNEAGFLEGAGYVISETAGGETAGNGLCASVGSVFEDGTMSVRAGGDDTNVVGVLNGGDNSSCED